MDLVIDRSEMHKKDKALAIAAIAAIRIANLAVTGEDMLKVPTIAAIAAIASP